ncbi:hypothetical protein ABZY05_50365, partial [Streptomyces canus]
MITLSGVRGRTMLSGNSSGAREHRPGGAFPDAVFPSREGAMTSRQVMTVVLLAAVLAWSTVMTVLGQL